MGKPDLEQLGEKLRLNDFAFFFSLQVGVVVVCCFGLVLTVIAFLKLCFNPLVEELAGYAAVSYLIVVLFIVASMSVYVLGLIGAALENARLLKIAAGILICVAVYWFILMCLSFSGDCNILRCVCVDNRCAERLFIQNGYWRQPIRDCFSNRSHGPSQFNLETTTPEYIESLYENEGDEYAVPETIEPSLTTRQDNNATGTWSFPTSEESPSVSPPNFNVNETYNKDVQRSSHKSPPKLKRAPTDATVTEGRHLQQKEDDGSGKMSESVTASNRNVTVLEASTKLSSKSRDHKPKGNRFRVRKLKKGGKKGKQSRHQVENENDTTYESVGHPVPNGKRIADLSFNNESKITMGINATTSTPSDANVTATNTTEWTSSVISSQGHCTRMMETTWGNMTEEDCSIICQCDCELYRNVTDYNDRPNDYDPYWTPIGDIGETQHFALSIVYACIILSSWYVYPILLIFSLVAQIQHGEVV